MGQVDPNVFPAPASKYQFMYPNSGIIWTIKTIVNIKVVGAEDNAIDLDLMFMPESNSSQSDFPS
jgi:hypothetical protein